jgi:hypothetical protein
MTNRTAHEAGHPSRYRIEAGGPCIDVKVESAERLFDLRDPAPFRGRDLDPGLVEYLTDAAEDLVGQQTYRVVFWLEKPCRPVEIEEAFRAHFTYVLDRLHHRRRTQRRTGHVALLLAIFLVSALLALSQVVGSTFPGSIGAGLKEGLVILAWVVLWRPVEVLIYDGIPVRRERRVVSKLLDAPIEVRVVDGPPGPPTGASVAGVVGG